ncbi:MAG: hypothetical protein GY898_06895 [Proteobacteria bacterium]|nr:hypothetical protein [Pseudomonadota bacterium]
MRSLAVLLLLLLTLAPTTVLAGGEASVAVEVIQGTKGGSGTDSKVSKHSGTLSNFGGFGGWKAAGSFTVKTALGKAASKSVSGRTFTATLTELTASKAKVKLVITDPKGKDHAVTSSFSKGGQTVLTSKSSDGSEMHVFVVRVSF